MSEVKRPWDELGMPPGMVSSMDQFDSHVNRMLDDAISIFKDDYDRDLLYPPAVYAVPIIAAVGLDPLDVENPAVKYAYLAVYAMHRMAKA